MGKKSFLFPIHQDLKILSNKSILIWIPLNKSSGDLGGVTLYKKSHKNGPLKHTWGDGYITLNKQSLKKISKLSKFNFTEYNVGDVLFISPLLVHQSIINSNKNKNRWTFVIHVGDMTDSKHLLKNLSPFNFNRYFSPLTNEELRKKFKSKSSS